MFNNEYATQRTAHFIYRVYGLMAAALAMTALVAYTIAATPALYQPLFNNQILVFAIIIGQLALVLVLSFSIMRISAPTALLLFFVYAMTVGITLSSIFLVFTQASIYQTFIVAAGMFGVMALYGYFTHTDLTTIGNIAFMVLIGLIIGLLINIFLKSPAFDLLLSAVGVIIFALLTAFDTQKLKSIALQLRLDDQTMNKIAVIGALTLYLDFLNLFLFLLQFMGKRRQD